MGIAEMRGEKMWVGWGYQNILAILQQGFPFTANLLENLSVKEL